MLANSSKHLYGYNNDGTNFEFLMRSMQRDKQNENLIPNHFDNSINNHNNHNNNKDSMTLSTPFTTTNMTKSIIQHQQPLLHYQDKCNNTNVPFFDNVKILKDSNVSCQEKKNYNKAVYKDNVSKIHNRQQILLEKVKKYVSLTDELLLKNSKGKANRKVENAGKQIMCLLQNMDNNNEFIGIGQNGTTVFQKFCNKNKKVSQINKMIKSVKIEQMSQPNTDYMKIINGLQTEKQKLSTLVSQHERANIKMYIKINEGQYQEIEMCKKQLSSLFEKYKQLQTMIVEQNNKVKKYQKEKEIMNKKLQQKNNENNQLIENIKKLQKTIKQLLQRTQNDKINSKNNTIKLNNGANIMYKGHKGINNRQHSRYRSNIVNNENNTNGNSNGNGHNNKNLANIYSYLKPEQLDSSRVRQSFSSSAATCIAKNGNNFNNNLQWQNKMQQWKHSQMLQNQQKINKLQKLVNEQNIQLENVYNDAYSWVAQRDIICKELKQKNEQKQKSIENYKKTIEELQKTINRLQIIKNKSLKNKKQQQQNSMNIINENNVTKKYKMNYLNSSTSQSSNIILNFDDTYRIIYTQAKQIQNQLKII